MTAYKAVISYQQKNALTEEMEIMKTRTAFTKRRWLMLFLYALVNLCVGSLYAWSVFDLPLQERIGVTNLTMAYTIATSIGPVTMISGGLLLRKLGTRRTLLLSGLTFGLCMFLSSCVRSLGALLITYGFGCGLSTGLAYGVAVGNSVKMFPDKRGMAGGISAATYGGSAVLVPPLATLLIEHGGVTLALRALGIVTLIVICTCAILIEDCPAGFIPDGWVPPASQSQINSVNWKQMMSTPLFYIMLLLLLCGAVSGTMVISQASPMAQQLIGMGTASAALMVSILSAFNATGRVVSGMLSDRIGRLNTLSLMLCVSMAGIFLVSSSGHGAYLMFGIGLAAIGLGFGAFLGVFPGFTADQFGPEHQSVNYGIVFIGFSLAGLIGPNAARTTYLSSGSYRFAFIMAVCLSLLGFVLAQICRKMTSSK